jgi:hypothetical protein
MKWIVSPILVSVLALPVSAGEIDAKAALGGALGGATGAAVGSALGGHEGAIIGGAIGGATGAALGSSGSSQHEIQPPTKPTRVIHRYPQYQHDQGLHLGHYKRKHKHKHKRRDDD